jgi:hypothetical protein
MVLGLSGAAGCGTDDCDCGPPEAIVEGSFPVTGVGSPTKDQNLFDATGATVTVASDSITIEYSRAEARVAAHYRVTRKSPQ